MQRIAYPVLNAGPMRIGRAEASWWAGFEQVVEIEAEPKPVEPDEVTYASSITRPACACKILVGLGQGCSMPIEGFPGGTVPKGAGEGPSTLAVIGGVAGVGVVLALVTGLI